MTPLDRFVTAALILIIRIYQLVISPFVKRECMFRPTCSHRAISILRSVGWRQGVPAIRLAVSECNGTYSLRLNAEDRVEMITSTGRVVPEDEIAESVASRVSSLRIVTAAGPWPVPTDPSS